MEVSGTLRTMSVQDKRGGHRHPGGICGTRKNLSAERVPFMVPISSDRITTHKAAFVIGGKGIQIFPNEKIKNVNFIKCEVSYNMRQMEE